MKSLVKLPVHGHPCITGQLLGSTIVLGPQDSLIPSSYSSLCLALGSHSLYLFWGAAVMEHHKLGGLKQQKCVLSLFWKYARQTPSSSSIEAPSCPLPSLVTVNIPCCSSPVFVPWTHCFLLSSVGLFFCDPWCTGTQESSMVRPQVGTHTLSRASSERSREQQ
jgi:hypothetical protein